MKKTLPLGLLLITGFFGFSQNKKTTEQKNDHSDIITIEQLSKQKNTVVEESPDVVYSSAGIDVLPEYIGSQTKFYTDFNKIFKLEADNEDIKGRVFVEFIVEKNGTLSNIKIIRDLQGVSAGKKVVETLAKMPKWKPGMQNEETLRIRYSIPIIIDIKAKTDSNSYYPAVPNKNIEIKELKSK